MKKLLSLLALLCIVSCTYAQPYSVTWSAGHIHVTITDTVFHDSATCHSEADILYTVTIDSSYTSDSVSFVDTAAGWIWGGPYVNTTGASPWTFTITNNAWSDDYMIPVGGGYALFREPWYKVVTPLDTLRYVAYKDSLWVSPCLYGNLSGDVYIDNNANCSFDAGDKGLIPYTVDINSYFFGVVPSIPSSIGLAPWSPGYLTYYSTVQKSWLSYYTVSLPAYYAFLFPMSPCFTGPYSFTTLPQAHVDFPLQCSSNIDLQCDALSPGVVRQHTAFQLQPYASNTGCDTVSGQLTLVKDSRVTYDAALSTHPADAVHGDTLVWNYATLASYSPAPYWNSFMAAIHLTPDMSVVAGDTLCFRVYTHIPSADVDAINNDRYICLPVVYSYDPNIKEVSPRGKGDEGLIPGDSDTLEYTIHFQNTGTAAAYDVNITDTLDADVNPASLRILGVSHNMLPRWLAPNVVQFQFANIFLPDSTTNEPASHGAVKFKIALDAGLPAGTRITNTAHIYFDLNPAVVTNTAVNTLITPTRVPGITTQSEVRAYPNPTTGNITVDGPAGAAITLLSPDGRLMLTHKMKQQTENIDISSLPAGIYILRVSDNATTSTTKLIKY